MSNISKYTKQQSLLSNQARIERYFWVSVASTACAVILATLCACGGSDWEQQNQEQDSQSGQVTSCSVDPNFVGPCEQNPPSGS